jgi:hypothetical protein
MKRNWLVLAFVFLFAAAGVANADTNAIGGKTNVLVGAQGNSISNIVITETAADTLGSVEEIPNSDGRNDMQRLPYPSSPNYNYGGVGLGNGCSGLSYRFYVTLNMSGVSWEYHATSATTFPGLDIAPVGYVPSTAPPFNSHTNYYPGLFHLRDPVGQGARSIAARISEYLYKLDSPMSCCYEWGHAVAVRYDEDPTSGFISKYDVVVTQVSSKTLTVDVIRAPAVAGVRGKIVIPGSVFRVNTSGVEAGTAGETDVPLMVTIEPAGTLDNGNLGITTQTVQVATLVSGDNPGTGANKQVVAPEGDIREVTIGATNQQASNIIITEQVDQQFQGATGDPRLSISLPNGILFHTQPVVSYSGGVVATLKTLSPYPTSEIQISVVQGAKDGAVGIIRISDIHLDLDSTVPIGDVMAEVAPVVAANNVQTLIGLDAASVDIANAVPSVVVDEDGAVSGSVGTFLLKVKSAPATTVTGNLYVSVQAIPPAGATEEEIAFGEFVWFRPKVVPLPNGFYVQLAEGPEGYLDGAASAYYKTGTLSENDLPLRFIIGGIEDLVGWGLKVQTFYTRSGQGLDQKVAIDSVSVIFN